MHKSQKYTHALWRFHLVLRLVVWNLLPPAEIKRITPASRHTSRGSKGNKKWLNLVWKAALFKAQNLRTSGWLQALSHSLIKAVCSTQDVRRPPALLLHVWGYSSSPCLTFLNSVLTQMFHNNLTHSLTLCWNDCCIGKQMILIYKFAFCYIWLHFVKLDVITKIFSNFCVAICSFQSLFLISLLSFLFGPMTRPVSSVCTLQNFLPSHNHLASPVSCLWVLISSARYHLHQIKAKNNTHMLTKPSKQQSLFSLGHTWNKYHEIIY